MRFRRRSFPAAAQLRNIGAQIPGLIWTTDLELRFTAVMGASVSALNLDPEAMVGQSVPAFLEERVPEGPVLQAHYDALAGKVSRYERERNGSRYEVTFRPLLEDGRIAGVIGVACDVTESRLLESRRAETYTHLQTLIDQLPAGTFITGLDWKGIYASPQVGELIEYSVEEWLADPEIWVRCIHPDDLPAVMQAAERLVATGDQFAERYRIRTRTGIVRWVSANIVRLDLPGKEPVLQGVVMDVTSEIAREQERQRLRQQMGQAQKMQSLGVLAGTVAHDFNNLLAVIANHADFVATQSDDESILRDARAIINAADRAAALTRKLLTFSSGDRGEPEVVDLGQVATGIRWLLQSTLGSDVALDVAACEEPATVLIDPAQFERILLNLAMNSKDAMPAGGRFSIEFDRVENPIERDGTQLSGMWIVTQVTDSGAGMSSDVLARACEPFFTTKTLGGGTGLGLSSVVELVNGSGGYVDLKSESGYGTTVTIYLPMHDRVASAEPEHAVQTPGRATLLLVDDDDAVRDVAKRILEEAGYDVFDARSAGAALLALHRSSTPIDLLITDLVMPVLSGFDLVAEARSLYPGLKVLYLSGYWQKALSEQGIPPSEAALLTGALVTKPFSRESLLRHVAEALAANRGADNAEAAP